MKIQKIKTETNMELPLPEVFQSVNGKVFIDRNDAYEEDKKYYFSLLAKTEVTENMKPPYVENTFAIIDGSYTWYNIKTEEDIKNLKEACAWDRYEVQEPGLYCVLWRRKVISLEKMIENTIKLYQQLGFKATINRKVGE